MAHFVYDNSSFTNYPKTNLVPIPAGDAPTKYIAAAEWNEYGQSMIDLREAAKGGSLTNKNAVDGGGHQRIP